MTEMTEVERLQRERDMAYQERDNAIAHRDGAHHMMTYSRECARDEGYSAGRKRALIGVLRSVVGELLIIADDDTTEHEANEGRLLIERHEAVLTLRGVCEKHGDNDWSDDLHLSDIIEKHLERHLDQ